MALNERKIKTISQEHIVAGFNQLRQEQRNLAGKVMELEADVNEHSLVIQAVKQVAEIDAERRCYQKIGDVLVEKNVKEVLPWLELNKKKIEDSIKIINKQITEKGKEITDYMEKFNIQVKQEAPGKDDEPSSAEQTKNVE